MAPPFLFTYFTPTRGLGCHSGSMLIYFILSVLIAILFATSTYLSTSPTTDPTCEPPKPLALCASAMRVFGNALALLNTIWIILYAVFHFTGLYNSCYCLSSYV